MEAARGKEDERGKIPSFSTIRLADVAECSEATLKVDHKYLFIADMSGKAVTFFTYNSVYTVYELHALAKEVVVHKKRSVADAQEELRK